MRIEIARADISWDFTPREGQLHCSFRTRLSVSGTLKSDDLPCESGLLVDNILHIVMIEKVIQCDDTTCIYFAYKIVDVDGDEYINSNEFAQGDEQARQALLNLIKIKIIELGW